MPGRCRREGGIWLSGHILLVWQLRLAAGDGAQGVTLGADGVGQAVALELPVALGLHAAIEDILLLAEYSLEEEWNGQVHYLPLR